MFKVLKPYYFYDDKPKCKANRQGMYILMLRLKDYGIGWLTDCGAWFFYVYLGKHGLRFSSEGFLTY